MRRLWLVPCFLGFALSAIFLPLSAQINADFSANITSGCSPVVVNFTDLSTGNPTAWFWDFGNANTSTLQNPSAAYVTPGQYTVTLTASGAGSNTETKTAYITVFQDPTGDFVATTSTSGCAPLDVTFQDLSTPGSGTINSWLWDFGDGQFSTQQNPSHTFVTGGTYTISLVVSDNNGCDHTYTLTNYITASNQPTADFGPTSPTSACAPPLTVNFTDQSTGGGSNYSYQWDFGDGGTSTAANPNHTYTALGTYTVTLIITDANGCQDTITRPNWVEISPVVTDFNSITTACVGQSVNFYDQTNGSPISWNWSFGDGGTSTQQNPAHVYNSTGTYTVSLTSSLGPNCTDTETKIGWITVTPGPVANFSVDSSLACDIPFTVTFTDLTTLGGLGIVNWYWDFGDSTYSGQQNPVHTYTSYGNDTVSLTVTDAGGCTSNITINDAVVTIPPNAAINAMPRFGCIPQTINFFDLSYSASPAVSWFWDFGDGTTSNLQNPTHTYTTLGRYDVMLIMVDSLGCTDTIIEPNYIAVGTPPTINLSATPLNACASEPIDFTSTSSPADEWFWDFGDGFNSVIESPTHLYRDTGFFDVRLSVGYFGCWVDTLLPNYVYRDAPVSRFGWSPTAACNVPFTANFVESSIDADTWFWDFGDGTTSSLQNPSHTYNAVGVYPVTLYTTNARTGCVDSTTLNLGITLPQPNFIVLGPRVGCYPFTVAFFDNSSSTGPIVDWYWTFGDGDTSRLQNPVHTYQLPGTYTVTLQIIDAAGCINQEIKTNFIAAVEPTADFTVASTNGCDPFVANFSDLSTADPASGVNIVGWEWSFGDGSSSTLQNPQHTYVNSGQYTVTLIVTDGLGCRDTLTRFNYINANSPTASFTVSDSIACLGHQIDFTNTTPGLFLNFVWDFGDGTTTTTVSPSHTYTVEDTFPISLIVLDPYGCRDTLRDTLIIADPVANFSATPTVAACPPMFVNFTDLSTPAGAISTWEWDFGDGNSSIVQNPNNLYATAGLFDVSLIVELIPGCRDTVVVPNLIDVQGPSGSFNFAPDSGCTPMVVTFNGTGQNTVSFSWDFGDGTIISGTADTVIHTYTQTGIFYPTMILDDGLGCTFPILSPNPVYVDTFPFVDFAVSSALLCEADSVAFTDLTVTNFPASDWYWDFGDGTTSTLQNPVHLYTTPGFYDVKLIVTTQLGCIDSIIKPAEIRFFNRPTADFIPTDTTVCPNSGIPFTDLSSGPQPILQWDWDFSNGGGSTVQNPTAQFGNSGNYTIQLIVTDSAGCQDTALATVEVTPGPTAAFTVDNASGCFNLASEFSAYVSGGIISWEWDLGNGTTGTGTPISTVYSQAGYYTASLIVTDTLGCMDTLIRPNYIFVDSIEANFGSDGDIGCPPYLVSFFDSSYSDTTLSYMWDFGDGGTSTLANPQHTYNTPGTFTVQLIITSPAGCSDTISQQVVEVYNNFPSAPSEIYRATVMSNFSTDVSWKPHSGYGFSHYVIYSEMPGGSGNWVAVDSNYGLLDTTFRHNSLNTRVNTYCYKVIVVDVCGYRSDLNQAQKHCTMDVTATPALEEILVTWTPYIGFGNLSGYEIYRVTNYDPNQAVFLNSVGPNTTTYQDEDLFCGIEYCYRIKAIESGGNNQVSWSDTSCAMPMFPNENTIEMVHATVEQNRDILVEWLPVPFNYAVELYVERSEDNQTWNVVQTLPPQALSYLDPAVEVQEQSYYYRVIALDSCGSRTQIGNHARSILLDVELRTYTPTLSWNPYTEWMDGVEDYEIEILNEATGQWDLVDRVDGTILYYPDKQSDYPQAEFCYRVRGKERAGNLSFSLSNEDCTPVGPILFAPSAFTPNGDGLNDGFFLTGAFIRSFQLVIFNRWGQKIFETNNLQEAWPGTYQGQVVQEGVYIYKAEAVGENGAHIEKHGTVTLIR